MQNKKIMKKQKGFTLIELLIVIGFIAVAGTAVYIGYNQVKNRNAATTEGRNLDTLKTGIKQLFATKSVYTGLANSVANDARITPDSMRAIPYVAGDGTITNSFGGAVTVAAATLGGGAANNGFTITYAAVPGSVCSNLVTSAAGFDAISVGGTVVKTFGTSNINVATTATQCAADTGNGVTIVFSSL